MDHSSFGCIVRGLRLRPVDDHARHGGDIDDVSSSALDHMPAYSLGTVKDPKVQVMGSDVIKGVTDPLQAAAMQEMEKQKAEMERQAQEALDKQKQELEKQKKEAEKKLKDKLKDLFKK